MIFIGAISTIISAFSEIDKWSGFASGGIDGAFNFFGYGNGFGFNCKGISPLSKGLEYFGNAMLVVGAILDIANSVYNNFNNPNYTRSEALIASGMDAVYYAGKARITYKVSQQVGKLAVKAGFAIGNAVALKASLGVAIAVGGLAAIAIGIVAAVLIYYAGELADSVYEKGKEEVFGL